MTPVKANDIRLMEKSGQLAAKTLAHVGSFVRPGITTNELDKIAHDYTLSNNARPAPLNYHGFPKSICTSVNECICHGVPDERPLQDGDIVNIDVTCELNGYYGDTSRMFFVGDVSQKAKDVCDIALKAMEKGIETIRPFGTTGLCGSRQMAIYGLLWWSVVAWVVLGYVPIFTQKYSPQTNNFHYEPNVKCLTSVIIG